MLPLIIGLLIGTPLGVGLEMFLSRKVNADIIAAYNQAMQSYVAALASLQDTKAIYEGMLNRMHKPIIDSDPEPFIRRD